MVYFPVIFFKDNVSENVYITAIAESVTMTCIAVIGITTDGEIDLTFVPFNSNAGYGIDEVLISSSKISKRHDFQVYGYSMAVQALIVPPV